MKILTLIVILQTAAIGLLVYEAYAPGTIAALIPEEYLGDRAAASTDYVTRPITHREFRYMIRDELARARADAPEVTREIIRESVAPPPEEPDSPFRSSEDVEAMMAVRVKLDSIVAGGTLSQAEFNELETAISRLHKDDRGEMLTMLVRAINKGELKSETVSD